MTQPRRHIAGQIAFITRRCSERRFFLRPDDYINQSIPYELGRAAERHGQQVYGVMAMSNHVHLAVGDTTGDRSYFMRDSMSGIARSRNRDLNREGHFWESGSYNDTVLLDQDAIERKLLYTWLNPVQAGLVERAEDWPGFKIMPKHWGETIRIEKPAKFYGIDSPDVVEFTPQPPPGYDDMTLEEVKEHFEKRLRRAEDEIAQVRREINEEVCGAERVKKVSTDASPTREESNPGRRIPRFATRNSKLMDVATKRYRAFKDRYETRRQRWVNGKKGVTFPCGTVQLKRCAPIKCDDPPEDEPGLFVTAG